MSIILRVFTILRPITLGNMRGMMFVYHAFFFTGGEFLKEARPIGISDGFD
jgi:hypothetical protein